MGLALLGIGIFAYVDGQDFNELVDQAMKQLDSDFTISLYGGTAALIIAISCIIVIVSFFGCCGAWKVRISILIDIKISELKTYLSNQVLNIRKRHFLFRKTAVCCFLIMLPFLYCLSG